jgi:hypothetical protein
VVVTARELALLEDAHRRLLGGAEPDAGPVPDAQGHEDGAEREARLSLVARGFLDASGDLPEDGDVALLVATVLDVRLAADRVLVAERVVAGGLEPHEPAPGGRPHPDSCTAPDVRHGTRLVHLLDPGACVEDVLPDGSHHLYLLLDGEEVVPWVTAVTVPSDATAGSGPALVVHPDRPEELPGLLGGPTVLAELALLTCRVDELAPAQDRSTFPAHHLLALGPSGCWVTDVEPGRPPTGSLVFRPVRPQWVEEWVRRALDPAPGPADREEGGRQGTMSG